VRRRAAGTLQAKQILEIEERTKHDVIAFLTMLRNSRVSRRAGFHLVNDVSDVLDAS